MPLKEKPLYTKITRKPSENEIQLQITSLMNMLQILRVKRPCQVIDVMLSMAAITLKTHLGDLKETKQEKITVTKPGWIINLDQRIVLLRRKIAHTELIIKYKQPFTTHQLKISTKLKQLFGNTKIRTLEYNEKILKQDLEATSNKLSYKPKLNERKSINKTFSINPKNIYRKLDAEIQKFKRPQLLAKKLSHFGRTFRERNLISIQANLALKH